MKRERSYRQRLVIGAALVVALVAVASGWCAR
jgi:hypothetical protein